MNNELPARKPFARVFFSTGVAVRLPSVGGKPLSGCDEARASPPRAYGQRYAFSRNAEPVPTPLPIAVCSLFLTFSCFARLFCYVRLKNICEIFLK